MQAEEIRTRILDAMTDANVEVKGDGYHYEVVVVSSLFEGQGLLQRQKKIMGLFKANILDGSLHALSVLAKTPEEWEQKNG